MFHRKSGEYKELTTIFRCVGALSGGTPPAATQPASPRLELPGKAPESAILRPSVQWWRSARSLQFLRLPADADATGPRDEGPNCGGNATGKSRGARGAASVTAPFWAEHAVVYWLVIGSSRVVPAGPLNPFGSGSLPK